MIQVAILISGRGSNLEALIKDQKGYQVSHVISNNWDAKGLEIAQQYGIKNTYINWSDREKAEEMLIKLLGEINTDLVVLAGFMRILSAKTVSSISKTINIHPSLLPKYPGLDTHQKVIDNNDIIHGATVHVVDDQLDSGLILGQVTFSVNPENNAEQLADELITKEHKLLTTIVGLIADNKLFWENNILYINNSITSQPILINE